MKINYFSDKMKAARKAAEDLNYKLKEWQKVPVLLMLSGGSAFDVLKYIDVTLVNKSVTITVLDERFSRDPEVNNFNQLMRTDFYRSIEDKANFIDTRLDGERKVEELAGRWERDLKVWLNENSTGKVIILQGVGEDGHTAGIAPGLERSDFEMLFENEDELVVGYDTKGKLEPSLRLTINIVFLRTKVDCSVVYMVGEKKKDVLKQIWDDEGSLYETPARILREMKCVEIFTDINV